MEIIKINNLELFNKFKYSIYQLIIDNSQNFEILSPKLFDWLENKVIKDLGATRVIYLSIGKSDKEITGLSILKKDNIESKICTLFVPERYRNNNIGSALIDLSSIWLDNRYPIITVPCNSIDRNSMNRFLINRNNYNFTGFTEVNGVSHEVFNDKELRKKSFIISINPEFSHKIINGMKTVEFRKKPIKNTVDNAIIYSTSPDKEIIGYFTVKGVDLDTVDNIWNKYEKFGGISKEFYDSYYKNHKKPAVAITINKAYKFNPINPNNIFNHFTPPQFIKYI